MTKSSIHEDNLAYFLEKQRFGDLLVYLNRRSEIMWILQITTSSAIVLIGLVAIMPVINNLARGFIGLVTFMDISLCVIYLYLLGRFEKKIAAAIRKAEEIRL